MDTGDNYAGTGGRSNLSPMYPVRTVSGHPPGDRPDDTADAKARRHVLRFEISGETLATFREHVVPRADGGKHDPDSMVVLCGAHHRALHEGRLAISGSVSAGLVFRHADGSEYGVPVSRRAADARASAFRGLRSLGFKESEARRAVEKVAPHVSADTNPESILRSALELLTQGVCRTFGGAPSSSA